MNTAEKFALDEHLSDYPKDATFDEVCEMIYSEDERVLVWAAEQAPPYKVVENIDCTKIHFQSVVDKLLNAQGETA
jgi:hypothetical protein